MRYLPATSAHTRAPGPSSCAPLLRRLCAGLALACLLLPGKAALALPITLGAAADFNALVLGDMRGRRSDVEGRLAVAGNADLEDFSVGMLLPDSGGSRNDLIVGGDARVRHTRMYAGNAVVGGTADFDDSVGFYRDVGAPGSAGSLLTPPPASFPVDFASLIDDLLWRSAAFGELPSTGETQVHRNDDDTLWGITFRGARRTNVFSVSATDLSAGNKRLTFDVPTHSIALVNVFGASVDLFDTGFYHTGFSPDEKVPDNTPTSRHDGRFSNGILFNFVDATTLDMHAVSLRGSVLAPQARTTFHDGHIDGNLIVGTFTTPDGALTGQVNDYRFRGEVPAPPSLALLLLGVALLLGRGGATRGQMRAA